MQHIYIYPDGLRGAHPIKWNEGDRQRERREVLEAAKKIENYCKRQNCDFCVFDGVICLKDEPIYPYSWGIDESDDKRRGPQ